VFVNYILHRRILNLPVNRNVRKICMNLVGAVCRPAGHKMSREEEKEDSCFSHGKEKTTSYICKGEIGTLDVSLGGWWKR
jgi:predicted phage gp36 major capsid-like protein